MNDPTITVQLVVAGTFVLLWLCWFFWFGRFCKLGICFVRSSYLILLPMAVVYTVLNAVWFYIVPLGIIAIEETIKLIASRASGSKFCAICIVSTYGIWEILIVKFYSFNMGFGTDFWANNGLSLVLALMSVAAMHSCTAIVYASYFFGRSFIQIVACITLHISFNEIAALGVTGSGPRMAVWPLPIFLTFAAISFLFALLWLRSRSARPGTEGGFDGKL